MDIVFNAAVGAVNQMANNAGAWEEVARLMSKSKSMNVNISVDKGGYPYAWIESQNLSGFKLILNSQILKALMNYLYKGQATSDQVDADHFECYEKEMPLTESLLRQCVDQGLQPRFAPRFMRHDPTKIKTQFTFKKGTLLFYVKENDGLTTYLTEKGIC